MGHRALQDVVVVCDSQSDLDAKLRTNGSELLLDTHGTAIDLAVWRLLELALERFGALPLVLERDRNIPPLAELLDEARKASALIARRVTRDDSE